MSFIKDIYFYNSSALAHEIREGALTEDRAVKHMIALFIISGFSLNLPVLPESVADSDGGIWSTLLSFIINGFICYYGVYLTYQANAKGDGKHYFLRFTVLSLPIIMQVSVLIICAFVALLLAFGMASGSLGSATGPVFWLFLHAAYMAFGIIFFVKMRNAISVASGQHA